MSILPLSVVIITKNEGHILGKTLESIAGLSDDIVIADNGSTDNTIAIATQHNCRVEILPWQGYGATKQAAQHLARHRWILFLDADEVIDTTLQQAIASINFNEEQIVYSFVFKNFLGMQHMRYGEMRGFKKIRLYCGKEVGWNNSSIHEQLNIPADYTHQTLPGFVLHYSMANLEVYAQKMTRYGTMMAHELFKRGKRATWFKLYLYPPIFFLQVYILKLGILDGRAGFACALLHVYYTSLKYHRLKELELANR